LAGCPDGYFKKVPYADESSTVGMVPRGRENDEGSTRIVACVRETDDAFKRMSTFFRPIVRGAEPIPPNQYRVGVCCLPRVASSFKNHMSESQNRRPYGSTSAPEGAKDSLDARLDRTRRRPKRKQRMTKKRYGAACSVFLDAGASCSHRMLARKALALLPQRHRVGTLLPWACPHLAF
jgi:hypothetical protein